MPTIPISQVGLLGANFASPKQSGPGIRVNAGQAINAAEGLSRAIGNAPRKPVEDFRGLQDLAQGIGDVGQATGEIAARNQNNIDLERATQAEIAIQRAEMELKSQIDQEQDFNKWGEIAGNQIKGLRESIDLNGVSKDTATRIEAELAKFQGRAEIGVKYGSLAAQERRTIDTLLAKRAMAVENKDDAGVRDSIGKLVSIGHYLPEQGAYEAMQDGLRIKQARGEDLKSRFSTAVLVGDDNEMERVLAEGAQVAGWSDADVQLMRTKGRIDAAQNREINRNKEQHDLISALNYKRAQGEVIVPSQIESLVSAGKIDKDVGARMLLAAKSDTGALPGEFSAFLDEVLTYDPDNDPKYEKAAALQRRAAEMGLRQDQASQFNAVFEKAQKENADVTKRVETHALVAARQTIKSAYEKGGLKRVWDDNLAQALQDTAKLEAFGIPAVQAAKIKTLMQGGKDPTDPQGERELAQDFTAAFREFKQAAQTRVDKSTAGQRGLSEWAYNLFDKAANSDADGNEADPTKAMEAAFEEASAVQQVEQWFMKETQKNGAPPDETAVKAKVGTILNSKLQGAAKKNASASAGKALSIRGFIPAPTLADRLPEPLKPYANDFIEAARLNNLDPYALAAIAMHETGGGTSSAFLNKNNAMGISDASGPVSLPSVRDSILRQAKTLARPGGPYDGAATIDQIGKIYAPIGAGNDPGGLNKYWTDGVRKYYDQLSS